MTSSFYIPPEGWETPVKLSYGKIRKFLVRWEDRAGNVTDSEVEAENFHDARIGAIGGGNYNNMVRAVVFERVEL